MNRVQCTSHERQSTFMKETRKEIDIHHNMMGHGSWNRRFLYTMLKHYKSSLIHYNLHMLHHWYRHTFETQLRGEGDSGDNIMMMVKKVLQLHWVRPCPTSSQLEYHNNHCEATSSIPFERSEKTMYFCNTIQYSARSILHEYAHAHTRGLLDCLATILQQANPVLHSSLRKVSHIN